MRKFLQQHLGKVLLLAAMVTGFNSWGQTLTEGFNSTGWGGSYGSYTVNNWPLAGVFRETSNVYEGAAAIRFNTSGTRTITSPVRSNGIATLSLYHRRWSSSDGSVTFAIYKSTDGSTWGNALTTFTTSSDTYSLFTYSINDATAKYVRIQVSSGQRALIDQISLTEPVAAPNLAISGTPTAHGPVCQNTAATGVTYTITNTGTAASGITVVSDNPQFVVSNLSSTNIAANGTATYKVTFTPTGTSPQSATITVASTTSGSNSPTSSLTGSTTTQVAQAVTSSAATAVGATTATLNGNVTTLGVCPASTEKGFVYSLTSANANPIVGGSGVTKTVVGSIATGAYTLGLTNLTPNTGYSFNSYVYDGTNYTYGTLRTFTTTNPTATLSGTLNEGTLNSALITVTLSGETFVDAGSFTQTGFILNNAPVGVTITAVSRDSATQATIMLAYDNTDFDTTVSTMNVVIPAANLTGGSPITSGNITVTAVAEAFISAGTLAFGNQCINTTSAASSFALTGNAKAGNINLAALDGYTYATTSGGTYTTTLSISHPGGAVSQTIFVKFSPTAVQAYNGNIVISGVGVDTSFNKPVTGAGVNTAPSISTPTSASVTSSTVILGGNITSVGCSGTITERGIYYSTTNNFADGTGTKVSELGSYSAGVFTINVSSLSPSTTYYYKAFATGSTGTVYTLQGNFTTACATPVNVSSLVTSTPATSQIKLDWSNSSCSDQVLIVAKLGSPVTATPSGDGTAYTANAAFGSGTTIATGEYVVYKGTGTSVTVTGLTNGSAYYFKVFTRKATSWSDGVSASDTAAVVYCTPTYSQGGANDYIASVTLENLTQATTSNSSPYYINYAATQTVVPELAKGVTYNLSLTFGNDSNQYNGVWIDFNNDGTFASGEFFTSNTNAGSNGTVNVSIAVPSGAVTGVVRMRIRGGDDDQILATQACGASVSNFGQAQDYKVSIIVNVWPLLTTTAAGSITANSASSGGTISSDNGSAVTARGIVYSTASNPTIATGTVVNSGSGTGSFTSSLTNLQDNKTYYIRAFATNGNGTGYGNQVTFTTSTITAPVATAATYLDAESSGFVANWNAVAGATGYFLDVATTSGFITTIISEDFSGVTTTNTSSAMSNFDAVMQTAGWTGSQVYANTGLVKLGSGSNPGVITTPSINLSGNGGNATLTFDVSQFSSDVTTLQVSHAANGGTTYVNVGSAIAVGSSPGWSTKTVTITGGTANSKIRITSGGDNRYYLDNIKISYSNIISGYDNLPVTNATSKNVTGLTAGNTYYYRVRTQGVNSTSGNSNTITAVAKREKVWNGSAWTLGGTAPTSMDKAVIAGDYNTSTNGGLTVGQLEVNSNTFTIASGTNVTVTNKVIVNTGANMLIENNGNLIQVNDVDNTGAVIVQKNSAPIYRLDYAMWSSPVAGETLVDFSPETISTRFYRYNPLSDQYATVPGSTTFAEGAGYLIRVANTHPAFVNAQTPGTSWHGTFVGTPNNGDVNVAVTPQQSGVSQGYNAVGNPYPSPINIHAFYAANTSSIADASALYFWRKKNDAATASYARVTKLAYTANTGNAWGDAGGTAFNGAPNTWVINPGQGFIVQATGSTVRFTNAMRVPVNNGQIFRTAQDESEIAISRLWLNLSGQDGFSQAAIGYTDMTTLGLDYGWDGKAFINDGDVTLFSLAGEETLGIQARPSFEASDVVPMGYQATQPGTYTIALDHMDGVFEAGQDIYLQDNLLNITHDLKQGAYEFTTEAGIITNRFNVIYAEPLSTENPTLDANSVIIYKDGSSININSGTVDITNVSVYDTRGRLLYSSKDINTTETVINGLTAEKQVLIVTISTVKGEVSKKIIF